MRKLLCIFLIGLISVFSINEFKLYKTDSLSLSNLFKKTLGNQHWANPYIENLMKSELMKGYPDGNTYPDKYITREETASIIYNLSGEITPMGSSFSDVNSDINWSFDAINSLYEQGYISGYPNGTFLPESLISREEFSSIVYNFLYKNNYLETNDKTMFSDIEDSWAKNQISILSNNNVISGYEDGTFKPDNNITRGEAAKVISESLNITKSRNRNEQSDIYTALYKGFSNFDNIFSFTYPGEISPEEIIDIYKSSFNGSYYEGIIETCTVEVRTNGEQSSVQIKAKYLHNKDEEMRLESYVTDIANEINTSYNNDYEKIKAAHNHVVTKAKYSEGDINANNSIGINVHTPYSILTDGTGVCQSYALLNHKILESLGYNTIYITGEAFNADYSGPHAWNLVEIDSNWYHIDTTWDDPLPDVENRILYDYFLVSDSIISKDHSWISDEYPSATTPFN